MEKTVTVDLSQNSFRSGSAYAGSDTKHATQEWHVSSRNADGAILPELRTLRDRSRDIERNNPIARGALKAMLSGVVGSGLRPRAAIDREMLGLSEEQAQAWQNRAEQEFRVWSESTYSDYMGELNFFGLQKLAYYSQKTSGDCFVLLPYDARPGAPYDLRVQLIESDRVCNKDGASDTDEIAGGIERDKDGKPVAIYIRTPHPGATYFSMLNTAPTWKRVPIFGERTGRRNVIHLTPIFA